MAEKKVTVFFENVGENITQFSADHGFSSMGQDTDRLARHANIRECKVYEKIKPLLASLPCSM
jgi:hypothetical protein